MKLWDNFWLAICAWLGGVNWDWVKFLEKQSKVLEQFYLQLKVAINITFAEKLAIYVYNMLLGKICNIDLKVTHLYSNRISFNTERTKP
jgi:hypothetical protein